MSAEDYEPRFARVLRLPAGCVASLSDSERRMLSALTKSPWGVVPRERLHSLLPYADRDPGLGESALRDAIWRLRAKLEAGTDGRVGITAGFTAASAPGYCLFDEGADDHLVVGALTFSRKGQVAWAGERKVKPTVTLTCLLEVLIRVYLDEGPSAYVPHEDLLRIIERNSRASSSDDAKRRNKLTQRIRQLRFAIAPAEVAIRVDDRGGYRLELPTPLSRN